MADAEAFQVVFSGAFADWLRLVVAERGWEFIAVPHGVGDLPTVGLRVGAPPSFTCPRCGRTSYNPHDVRESYCGRCRDWTGS